MTISIFIYYDIENKISAVRSAKKYEKQGYDIKQETNCIILKKKL